jgi:hypothetical protein
MMFRVLLLVLALAIGGATLDGRPAGGAGISDVISDFLYYQEELKVKAPARPITEILPGWASATWPSWMPTARCACGTSRRAGR